MFSSKFITNLATSEFVNLLADDQMKLRGMELYNLKSVEWELDKHVKIIELNTEETD